MPTFDHTYVLITPARNEEAYIGNTLESIIKQTIKPIRWVVVSDRSTDRTDEIIASYAARWPFIRHIRLDGDPSRNFGSQVRAINRGYEELMKCDYRFIGNLDADISLEPWYYEKILELFSQNPQLGITGGFIFEQDPKTGRFINRASNHERSVAHAIQLFRRECYEAIGGYRALRFGGADTVAEEMVRMKGWRVQAFPHLAANHHKPTLTAEGVLRGGFRQGQMDHAMGTDPLFEIMRCARRINHNVFLLYSLFRYAGYLWQVLRGEPRDVEDDFVLFLQSAQRRRLLHVDKALNGQSFKEG